jgi:hypothetical protein
VKTKKNPSTAPVVRPSAPSKPESNPRKRRRGRKPRGRRGRRRNPWDGDAAVPASIGAGVGSLVGGLVGGVVGVLNLARVAHNQMVADVPLDDLSMNDVAPRTGAVMLTPALAAMGSIAGGAIGAHIGAPDKREGKATLGGAIGGLFGPIGAAAGGAIGAGYTKRRGNPAVSTVALVVGGIAAIGAAAYAVRRWGPAMRLTPGTPTEPLGPGPMVAVPKVYVGVGYEGGKIGITAVETQASATHEIHDHDYVEIVAAKLPIDVVLSVPNSFNPITDVATSPNATVVAGEQGKTRDIIVRVKGPATIEFSTQLWDGTMAEGTGHLGRMKVFVQ